MLTHDLTFANMPSTHERHALLQKYRTNLHTRSLQSVSKEQMLHMVCSILTTHAPESIAEITQQMDSWRELPVTAKSSAMPVMLALVAFGDEVLQSLLFLIFTYALQPTLIYSAFVKPPSQREFEMIVLSKKHVDVDQIERFVEKLKMSICVIQFSKYMSADMLESMNRLHCRGKMKIGNFQTDAAARVRRCFYYHMNKKRKQTREREVLLSTGYSFTPQNMIMIANMLRQERAENEAQRRTDRERRTVFVLPQIHAWHSMPGSPDSIVVPASPQN